MPNQQLSVVILSFTYNDVKKSKLHVITFFYTECRIKTKEIVYEKCKKIDSKKNKLLRTHAKERSRVLDSAQTHSDLQEFVKVSISLLVGSCVPCRVSSATTMVAVTALLNYFSIHSLHYKIEFG